MKHVKKITHYMTKHGRMSARFIVAILVLVLGGVIAMNMNVKPVVAGPGQPFGGLSYEVLDCTCSGNFAIYFNDLTIPNPVDLPLIYEPGGTILYEFGQILTPGTWILGTWLQGGECLVFIGKGCGIIPTAGTMYMVGTSQ